MHLMLNLSFALFWHCDLIHAHFTIKRYIWRLVAWLLLQVELLSYPPVTPPRSVNVFVLSYVLTLVPIISYVSAYQWVLFDKFHLPQRIRRRRYRLLRWLRVLKPGRYKSFTQYSYTDCKIGQANPGGAFDKGFIRSSETNSERECI